MNKLTRTGISLLLSSTMILGVMTPFTYANTHYVVKSGDTLQALASVFNTTVEAIIEANDLPENTNILEVNQMLTIPTSVSGEKNDSVYQGSCGENVTYTLDEKGILTLSGTGATYDYKWGSYAPWYDVKDSILSVVVESGVTTIGSYLFYSTKTITTVSLSDTITRINTSAFEHCSNLSSVIIPQNVTNIGYSAFGSCTTLTSVVIPDSVTTIIASAFGGCTSLVEITTEENNQNYTSANGVLFNKDKTILVAYPAGNPNEYYVIPDNVNMIEAFAFNYCRNLNEIKFPNSLTEIKTHAFSGCSGLTEINLPDSLTTTGHQSFISTSITTLTVPSTLDNMGSYSFEYSRSLEEVIFLAPITTIGSGVFRSCPKLTKVTIPSSVTTIDTGAFLSTDLTDVYYGGSEEQWNLIEISDNLNQNDNLKEVTIHYNSPMAEYVTSEITYSPLPNAIQYTSYLTGVYDVGSSSTLISGNLPKGLGLYEDGVIGGIPQETGTFEFVIATSEGEVGYSLTVEAPTTQNVEANNDFDIIERVPTVDSNEKEYIFEVTGEFSDFLNVYLDGELLVKDVHYFSEEGSTKITIAAQTMSQLDSGSHVINATFETTNAAITPSNSSGSSSSSGTITTTNSSKSANVASVAQGFEKIIEPAPMMAMPFTDVAVSDWHYRYVRYMYDTSTFSGVTDTTYEPNTGMTRAMMAVVFYGMADKPSTNSANFSDVVDGEWYTDAVNWVSQKGIDDSVGNFRPTDLITREETAKMMYNFCTDQGIFIPLTTSRTPSDMNSVSDNAKNAVNILFSKGIFAGDDANNFNPHNTSTRAEISAMMRTFMWATV